MFFAKILKLRALENYKILENIVGSHEEDLKKSNVEQMEASNLTLAFKNARW